MKTRRRRMRPHIPVPIIEDCCPISGPDLVAIAYRLPPAILSPNSSATKLAKAESVRIYRNAIAMKIKEKLSWLRDAACPWPKATMEIHWYHATLDHPDDDNCIGWLKSARDGATDGGIVNDDQQMKVIGVEFFKDPTCPRVVLIFRRRA